MPKAGVVQVLDHDVRRGASVDRQLMELGITPNSMTDWANFRGAPPGSGLLLVFDDSSRPTLSEAVEIIENKNGGF